MGASACLRGGTGSTSMERPRMVGGAGSPHDNPTQRTRPGDVLVFTVRVGYDGCGRRTHTETGMGGACGVWRDLHARDLGDWHVGYWTLLSILLASLSSDGSMAIEAAQPARSDRRDICAVSGSVFLPLCPHVPDP